MQSLHKFKQTELGMIPKGWEIKKLSDIGQITGGGTPDTTKKDHWENGDIAWAVPTDLTSLKTNYIDKTERYITKKGLDNSAAKLLPQGAVLITSRATIGECAITTIPITTNQGFQNIICNSENNNLFLLYVIKFNKGKLIRKSHGTTFLEISKNNIKNLKLPIPPLIEQQKIAYILSNVDELIQKTEQIIKQTQRLKKGLMQRLLTKGIGHTKFKKIELGEIPEEWQLVDITHIIKDKEGIKTGPFGSSLKKEIFVSEGYKIYGQENVIPDDFTIGDYFISEEVFLKMKTYEIKPGDILISLVGTHGKVSIVPANIQRGIINPRLLRIRLDQNKVIPLYMKILLESDYIEKQIKKLTHGLTMGILNTNIIRQFYFVIPPIEEQKKIISIFFIINRILKNLKDYKSKNEWLKKGLMQQLLTGKIRVKV